MSLAGVISGDSLWHVETGDSLAVLQTLPDGCGLDLSFSAAVGEAAAHNKTRSNPMFIGYNELILNEATIIVAVQEWLETHMDARGCPTVTSVKPDRSQDSGCSGPTYRVMLTDPKPRPE